MVQFIHKTGLAAEACISSQGLEEGNPSSLSEVPVPGRLWHGWSRHLPAPGAERHAGQALVLPPVPQDTQCLARIPGGPAAGDVVRCRAEFPAYLAVHGYASPRHGTRTRRRSSCRPRYWQRMAYPSTLGDRADQNRVGPHKISARWQGKVAFGSDLVTWRRGQAAARCGHRKAT